MALLLFDLAFFSFAFVVTILADSVVVKTAMAVVMALAIARLFIIGHDACHQSFVSDRDWNRRIGWLAFLPSLTTYSLWEAGHNLGHHVYTNLQGRDYVWTPFSKHEFDALPRYRQRLERLYRSGGGFWAYYLIELWWKTLYFPTERDVPGRRPVHQRDSMFVSLFALVWIGAIVGAALATGQSVLLLLLMALVLPFLLWCGLMGTVIYYHHTHPRLRWYRDALRWEEDRDGVSTTAHVQFHGRWGWLLNNIMTHPAHHLDVRIPLYNIEAAQRTLSAQDVALLEQRCSWRYLVDTVRCCKLYDYDGQRWMNFEGGYTSGEETGAAPTSAVLRQAPAV